VVRTELQKRLGGYRRELPHSGDLEMWLRLAAHASAGILSQYQAAHRLHGNNMQFFYYRDHLPDLEQRKAAFDFILESCSRVFPDIQLRHRRLLTPLAFEALAYVSGSFNDGDLEIARQLCAFTIDDGSSDSSGSILDSYQRQDSRVRVYHQGNREVVESLNRGWKAARGKYIARMDGDDIAIRDRLTWQVAFMEEHPEGKRRWRGCRVGRLGRQDPRNIFAPTQRPRDQVSAA
jgi:hypothetical protein